MRDKIQEALKRSKADYTEIRIEDKETSRVVFRGKELETAGSNIDKGGIVRCLIKDKGWGVATFNDLDDLATKVDQAYQCAQVGSVPEPIELASVEPVEKVVAAELKRDFRDISLAEKKALAERYNQILLGHSDIARDGRVRRDKLRRCFEVMVRRLTESHGLAASEFEAVVSVPGPRISCPSGGALRLRLPLERNPHR